MKKIFNSFLIVAVMASVASISSCTKTCDAGYEGSDCKTEIRAKVIGTYRVVETCSTTGGANYNVTITASGSDVTKVLVSPFAGYPGVTGIISVDGTTLTIASQTVAGYTFSGSGTINNGGTTITANYTISDGTNSESCPGTWTKQ